jgi:hypothetical protein
LPQQITGTGAFQPGLSLRHVRARHHADIKPVLRRAHLLTGDVHIVLADGNGFAVAHHVHIGSHHAENQVLPGCGKAKISGADARFCLADAG